MRLKKVGKIIPIIALFHFFQMPSASAQISGCTDPAANNYNTAATVNDGSCTYNATFYTPVIQVDPLSSTLNETSALQLAGNYLWTLNDGGGAAAIYRIDTSTNTILQKVTLGGASNGDWEDLAFDGTHLYIGAFGNNVNGARTDLRIYKLPLSAIPTHVGNPDVTIPSGSIEVLNFSYSGQPQPLVPTSQPNSTAFDCSAMIVDGGKIHLFTKNWIANNTTHYVINGVTAGDYVATPVEELETGYLVTAADKLPGTDLIVLLGYQNGIPANHYLHLLSEYSGGLYFNGNKRMISLPDASVMGQAEGITFRTNSYGYISNERVSGNLNGTTYTVTPKLFSFNITELLPAIVLPLVLKKFDVQKTNGANRIQWNFATPVKQLQVQFSSDRTNFTTVQSFTNAVEGTLMHQPVTAATCYRLVWKNAQGAAQFSEIKCISSGINSTVSAVVLRRNGELIVTKQGADNGRYAFRLVTTDGKVVAQSAEQTLAAGVNRIHLLKNFSAHALLVLEIVSGEERSSVLLKVQ
ncbi:MAG TPA: hypothetical protein VGN63_19900 [Flavisolibacter sp.]|jgi:hypothetical protein|nr:hypothetical protein [Flavisolibacter sp.]